MSFVMHRTRCNAVTRSLVKVKDMETKHHIVNSVYEVETSE